MPVSTTQPRHQEARWRPNPTASGCAWLDTLHAPLLVPADGAAPQRSKTAGQAQPSAGPALGYAGVYLHGPCAGR